AVFAGDQEAQGGAPAWRGVNVDATTMRLGDRSDDRQPEAGPSRGPISRRVGTVEGLERARHLLGREARTPVRHLQYRVIPIGESSHRHWRASGGMYDRVRQEVRGNL